MSDFFKIVQTTENGLRKLTVVPSGWENKGVLYWPTTSKCNITDSSSKPDGNKWRQFPCQLKRTGFITYQQANEELDAMAVQSDTDDTLSTKSKRRRMSKKKNVSIDNFQNLLGHSNNTNLSTKPTSAQKKEIVFSQPPPVTSPKIVIIGNHEIQPPSGITYSSTASATISQNPSSPQEDADGLNDVNDISADDSGLLNDNIISFVPEELGMQLTDFNLPINHTLSESFKEKILEKIEKIETKLDERKQIDETIIRSLARLEAKIDAFAQAPRERAVVTCQADILKPIKTLDEAISLEEELKEEVYFQNIVNQMKIKLSKNLRSFNCCYSLVDLFFERAFFRLCSWSGQSRSQGLEKYPFKSFRRILNCFFYCVRSIDGDFTFGECESFFKDRTLKHSAQREKANSGRVSKIKHRPTGIPNKKLKKSYSTVAEIDNHKNSESGSNENDENKENKGDFYNNCNLEERFSQSGNETSSSRDDKNYLSETDESDND